MELWYREDRDTWRWRFKDKNGEWHTGLSGPGRKRRQRVKPRWQSFIWHPWSRAIAT